MNPIVRTSFALLSASALLGGCVVKSNNQSSTDPNAGGYDDYYNDGSGPPSGDGSGSGEVGSGRVRDASGTRGVASRKGVKKIRPKKPVIPAGGRNVVMPPKPTPLAFESFVPTAASKGSAVELFGGGFASDAGKNAVTVAGVSWPVQEAAANRLVVQVPDGAKNGVFEVKVGGKTVKSKNPFSVLEDDGGFGKPTTDAVHGLLGNVYNIGKSVSEMPAIDDLGDPISVIAVDTLDVPKRDFKQGFPGVGTDVVEWFAIHFKGSLNILEEGEYEMCLNSDDGSILYLDGNTIVDNDGVHASKEVCELVYLYPGEYAADVLYFQGPKFEIALQWSWAKDGGTKGIVPRDNLFRPENPGQMGKD